ncbi:lipopolysaccharide biosynthesis protein [Fictibacillus sp. 18YEL24]|uniref:lipopolysaccharide biosynthesis protein n=1 Tax=Fictibacillus sp. 18YEL24 TaxID=2745875 RepID=UPI0018CDDF57|nr:oligosaccharide flippase family protein [Fictibacillus sp. 18YEL24]MBH0169330.1 oligosaccharide flippase family protein [Fictibacillus sp. 18YEL24]
MLAQIKRLGGDSLLYAFMNLGTKFIAFLMFPIYTYYLTPSEYGVIDLIDSTTAMLTFLIIFGTDSALAFYYFDVKDKEKRWAYIRNVLTFRLMIALFFVLIVLVGGYSLSELLLKDTENYRALLFAVSVLLIDTVLVLVLSVFRFEYKTLKVVAYTVGKMFLIALISYVFLRFIWTSVEGIILGRLIAVFLVLLLMGKQLLPFLRFRIDKDILKEVLKYAAPLVPASIAFWVIVNSNRFFLREFGSMEDVGIYGSAMKFATLITLVTTGIQMAWRPYSMELKDKKGNEQLFAKLYLGILLIGLFGVMAITTVMPWVIQILDDAYAASYQYVGPISAVTFLNFYYLIISVGLFIKKETKYISYYFGIAAVVNVILNLLLIPMFSIWGTVAAYLLSYIIAVVLVFRKSQKVYYIPISFLKISILFLITILLVGAMVWIQENDSVSNWHVLTAWLLFFASVGVSRVDRDFRKKGHLGDSIE